MLNPIYTIIPLSAHRFKMRLQIVSPEQQLQCYLPIWIPGSYTRRDFSRFVSISTFENNGKNVAWQLTSPSSWSAEGEAGTWLIEYEVYARDYSVRGCYLDDERAIFNPACACLALRGAENSAHTLIWQADSTRQTWQIAGAIPNQENQWQFEDYQHLIDTPLMMAKDMTRVNFVASGVPHEIAICGAGDIPYDLSRLSHDVEKICHSAIAQFGALPECVKHYSFLLFLTQNGYGGLEHQRNTLLMASRNALPSSAPNTSAYTQLLGLFSHEYFHTWNVKSLRPTEYAQGYDLEREQPSEMLWLFEGFTAYFDNLILLYSDCISSAEYLKLLSNDISRYLQRVGHQRQTLAHSSFEAWTKLYNGGENAGNISTNYYIHGPLAAWCIDTYLRTHIPAPYGLENALRELWQDPNIRKQGLNEARFIEHIQQRLADEQKADFGEFLHQLLHCCDFLPLDWAAQQMGLALEYLAPQSLQDLGGSLNGNRATSDAGFRWQQQNGRFFVLINQPDSAAAQAGIAANDEIISICGETPTAERLWQALMLGKSGQHVQMTLLRDGLMRHYQWQLGEALKNTACLSIQKDANHAALARCQHWLKHNPTSTQ